MAAGKRNSEVPLASDPVVVVRVVTVIMGTVVGLTFLFGFGNVLNLALHLGVPVWVAPLVAPAVDLTILGILLGTRHLVVRGVGADALRPLRRLLIFASVVTLALNVAGPLVAGEYGKAAFDAVGPLLLIGWSEVGPGLLQAMIETCEAPSRLHTEGGSQVDGDEAVDAGPVRVGGENVAGGPEERPALCRGRAVQDDLLGRAREEDESHWARYRRPISAETLRKRLGVGAARSRVLVSAVRSGQVASASPYSVQAVRAIRS
ncbi:hypothetical protein [Amycolatopsis saalfeldensis]|uniref:DUF2637 domain-containing protein n=1 Tax=Amycolatopsis saalfeldensis TaxID=394193 RepID=A0A1H8Y8W3_9PSEU|nr:hypothetical protein [Amycolatopsis saalfeldensis]SEP48431.1 hypothetical protein SAMN04489732_11236 [Amycolatopsis saalfeldensis]